MTPADSSATTLTPNEDSVAAPALRLGLIGLDTSHVEAFAGIINNPLHSAHPPAARITAAFPAGSADFALSFKRVDGYTRNLREKFGVAILPSIRAVAKAVDAILITSVDGRVHRAQFAEIAAAGKPVFIDKPFATSSADAREIANIAAKHGVRVFSSSNLRFAGAWREALADVSPERIQQAEFAGPLRFEPTQPGYFWYGVHTVEMLYAALGPGCTSVEVHHENDTEIITGTWSDRRRGIARLDPAIGQFGGVLRYAGGERGVDIAAGLDPIVGLTHAMIAFFRGGPAPVPIEQTVELIRFLEAANESRESGGRSVRL